MENYLSFARVKSDVNASFDVIEIINNITQMLGYSARKSGIRLDLQLPKESLLVRGSPNHFRQILTNLLLNSIQAMQNIGEVNIRIIENPGDVLIAFEDSGHGIPSDKINEIFDPLFTTKQLGTGLGLSICKNIVEQHGGNITVKNNPTTFLVKLPKNI